MKTFTVVNKTTGKKLLLDEYSSKSQAEQAIVNTIVGAAIGKDKKQALKYYQTMYVKVSK